MHFFLLALALLLLGSFLALVTTKKPKLCCTLSTLTLSVASLLTLFPSTQALFKNILYSIEIPWHVPGGAFHLEMDPLSSLFSLIFAIITITVSVYLGTYLKPWFGKKNLGVFWFFLHLLIFSLFLIVLARNAILFFVAWEIMSVTSFFLIAFEDDKPSVQKGSLYYLIATQISSLFLLPFFILSENTSYLLLSGSLSVLFLLSFVGFGTKAGFVPFHAWLPNAYAAAPHPISAILSSAVSKIGLYGILRFLIQNTIPTAFWAYLFIGIGIFSGIFGICLSLVQKNLKKALAYSSIENMGIITLGIGLGLLGLYRKIPFLTLLGFGGSCIHLFNHSMYKGLLFLGSGSLFTHTQTDDISQMGGLAKKMPLLARFFLVGSLSIAAIPSFNGFVGEFFLFLGIFEGIFAKCTACFLALLGLSIIGGLTLLCFTGLYGTIFLGENRSLSSPQTQVEKKDITFLPMGLLAVLCMSIGILLPLILPSLSYLLEQFMPFIPIKILFILTLEKSSDVFPFFLTLFIFYGSFTLFYFLRRWAYRNKNVRKTVTWDCGFIRPSPRIQYTYASFTQPLTSLYEKLVTIFSSDSNQNIFWKKGFFHIQSFDPILKNFYSSLFTKIEKLASKIRWIQHGRVQSYILYIFITLLVLLVWKVV